MPNPIKRYQDLLPVFFKEKYPDRSNIEILNLEDLTAGWDTSVYSFDLSYIENALKKIDQLVMKMFSSVNHAEKAKKEYKVMEKLRALDYPVPEVKLLDLGSSLLKKPVIVMEKIDGRLFWFDMDKAVGPKKRELLAQYCQLLAGIHTLEWNQFTSNHKMTSGEWMDQELVTARKMMNDYNFHVLQAVLNWLEDSKTDVRPAKLALLHGDYHSYNIILKNSDNEPIVIDWGRSRIGDFRYDLAWTMLIESTYGDLEIREQILDEYQRITRSRVDNIDFFEVLVIFWRFFYMLLTITRGANVLGYREGVEEYMKQRPYHLKRAYKLLEEKTGLELSAVKNALSLITG